MPFGSCAPVCLISNHFPFDGLLLYVAVNAVSHIPDTRAGLILTWAPGSPPSPGINPISVSRRHVQSQGETTAPGLLACTSQQARSIAWKSDVTLQNR